MKTLQDYWRSFAADVHPDAPDEVRTYLFHAFMAGALSYDKCLEQAVAQAPVDSNGTPQVDARPLQEELTRYMMSFENDGRKVAAEH